MLPPIGMLNHSTPHASFILSLSTTRACSAVCPLRPLHMQQTSSGLVACSILGTFSEIDAGTTAAWQEGERGVGEDGKGGCHEPRTRRKSACFLRKIKSATETLRGRGTEQRRDHTEQRAKLVSTVFDITVYFCSPFLPSSLLPSLPCVLTGVIAFGVRQNRRKIGCTAPL